MQQIIYADSYNWGKSKSPHSPGRTVSCIFFARYTRPMETITFDRVFAFFGFALTLWQLYRTQTIARAAKKAADDAVAAIRGLEAVTKMHDISSRSRELLRLLRVSALGPAASAAFELRDTVARYRNDAHSRLAISPAEWDRAVVDVRAVHERLESLAMVRRTRAEDREMLLLEVARLHTFFTGLAAQA